MENYGLLKGGLRHKAHLLAKKVAVKGKNACLKFDLTSGWFAGRVMILLQNYRGARQENKATGASKSANCLLGSPILLMFLLSRMPGSYHYK